jgi:bifunctional DNase/RNase
MRWSAAFRKRFIDSEFRPSYILPKGGETPGVEIEMILKGYVPDPITNMPVIILREVSGERVLPIWVGVFEGNAIQLQFDGIQTPRPMTHDLLKTVIEELGGHLERVVVCDLRDNTFYATLHVLSPSGPRTVDARPSDAIALAQRSGARIFVEEAVIQKARSGEMSREAMDVGRLEKWLANLSDDDLGKYKM